MVWFVGAVVWFIALVVLPPGLIRLTRDHRATMAGFAAGMGVAAILLMASCFANATTYDGPFDSAAPRPTPVRTATAQP